MDDVKDIKKDQVTRFLGNKTLRVQAFGSNVSAERAYRRAERVSAGIYLVTNHIADHEPSKRRARRMSLDLLAVMLELVDGLRNPEAPATRKTHRCIRELISIMRLLAISGHVSQQNSEMIIEALDDLANFLLVSQRTTLSEDVALKKDDFLDEGYQATAHRVSDKKPQRTSSVSVKDRSGGMRPSVQNGNSIGQRSGQIAAVLRNQGQLGIKDIMANLPEYSEKMIQRELKALVDRGQVRKLGSKRWSRYALAEGAAS